MSAAAQKAHVPAWVRGVLSPGFADEIDNVAEFMRAPDDVMSPRSLSAMTATRLSFAKTLIDRMTHKAWMIQLKHSEVAADGTGFLAYEIDAEGETMHFGAFAYPPLPLGHQRLFRDTRTDFFGALVSGPLDLNRLRREQAEFDEHLWRGRTDPRVYGWTIASRGTRTFEDVVEALADGRQPDVAELDRNGGYILRNGGYYGNGRMGTRAWQSYAHTDDPLSTPYHVDLFCLYLWRLVSFDVVDAAARARSEEAAVLGPDLKRYLGIGNSSGLGTVAALVRWPARLSAYMLSRELAFAYAKSRQGPVEKQLRKKLVSMLSRAAVAYGGAPDAAPELIEARQDVSVALTRIAQEAQVPNEESLRGDRGSVDRPWLHLVTKAEEFGSREAVELLQSFLVELYPETSELSRVTVAGMARDQGVQPTMSVGELRTAIEENFAWVLDLDLDDADLRKYFWYRSEENGENRRGERARDVGVERETFIDVAGVVRRLYDFLAVLSSDTTVGQFLLEEPEHTLAVSRVQLSLTSPFSEIRASVCSADVMPSAGIRCFLTVLGLELPTPHSARWVRGVFYRGAPLADDLADGQELEWILPVRPGVHKSSSDVAMARA